ncbi:dicarboxylate/amino acid:cation symporter, partial [Aureispira]|nr:dicarboxylate/amino acid:cation symporter [Aureispira sp.]
DPVIFGILLQYAFCVVIGLTMMLGLYLMAIHFYTGRSTMGFLKAISPAQLLAFSTSSSAATLPVTMERVEEHVGVEKDPPRREMKKKRLNKEKENKNMQILWFDKGECYKVEFYNYSLDGLLETHIIEEKEIQTVFEYTFFMD